MRYGGPADLQLLGRSGAPGVATGNTVSGGVRNVHRSAGRIEARAESKHGPNRSTGRIDAIHLLDLLVAAREDASAPPPKASMLSCVTGSSEHAMQPLALSCTHREGNCSKPHPEWLTCFESCVFFDRGVRPPSELGLALHRARVSTPALPQRPRWRAALQLEVDEAPCSSQIREL